MLGLEIGFRRDESWHMHHVLPLQSLTIPELGPFLGYARKGGFSFDNFADNGLFLPSTEEGALATGLPVHRGSHPNYSQNLIDYLRVVAGRISSTLGSDADAHMAAQLLRVLARATKNGLTEHQGTGRLGYVDDMVVHLPGDRTLIRAEIQRHRASGRFGKRLA